MKASELKALERIYRRRIPSESIATPELIRELATRSHALGRRLGVLVDRNGGVSHVFVGGARDLAVPTLDDSRRGQGRLKGLRWLATTLRSRDPHPDDLNELTRWRLDLLLLISVDGAGEPAHVREVHLVPAREDGRQGTETGDPVQPHELPDDLPVFLAELEQAFEDATPDARATGGEARPPIVLAVVTAGRKPRLSEELSELRSLARAAGYEVRGEIRQRRERMDPHTLMGKGRVADLASLAVTTGAQRVVFNEELAPRQQVALEDLLNLRVLDRTQLILELFAQRARTHAGKLQVEAARLHYALPRLVGRGTAMSRVGGGKGAGFGRTKGSGEKKLEVDRRRIRDRIATLERELERLRRQGRERRRRRQVNQLPHVALVGYTNAGKSTLFNRLTGADVRVEDAMFASLDPTVRQRRLPSGRRVLFSDSVGFIRRLPKSLVEAFHATLDELDDATLLLHLADASDPHCLERVEAVRSLLEKLGHGGRPQLLVFNKIDALEDPGLFLPLAHSLSGHDPLLITAQSGSLDALLERLEAMLTDLLDTEESTALGLEDRSLL